MDPNKIYKIAVIQMEEYILDDSIVNNLKLHDVTFHPTYNDSEATFLDVDFVIISSYDLNFATKIVSKIRLGPSYLLPVFTFNNLDCSLNVYFDSKMHLIRS